MKFKSGLFLKEAVLFGATLAIGIFSAYRNIASSSQIMIPEVKFGWGDAVFLSALALFFIFFSKHQRVVHFSFKLFLVLIVFSGSSAVVNTVSGPPWDIWVPLLVTAVFLSLKSVIIHNAGIILGIAGIGSLLGLAISPGTAVIIMIILSFYDIVAVYTTKHMVKMAKVMMESGAIFGFIIPLRLNGFFSHKQEAQIEAGAGGRFISDPSYFCKSEGKKTHGRFAADCDDVYYWIPCVFTNVKTNSNFKLQILNEIPIF